jgi:glycosyltransferase involved in cell wall biosynthesis
MEKKPLASVVIPLYNGQKFIDQTIKTVLNQDFSPLEIIVVDDGSTDSGAGIVKNYEQVRYFYQENQGNAAARNQGICKSKGEFIALLDQDDLWEKHKLRTHLDYMIRHPEIYYTIARFKYFLSPGVQRPKWCRENLLREHYVDYSPSSLVVRKRVFNMVGYFDWKFKTGSDGDWFFRAKDMKIPMAVIDEVLLYRRVHHANQSKHVKQSHAELLKVIRKSIARKKGQRQNETG